MESLFFFNIKKKKRYKGREGEDIHNTSLEKKRF